MLGRRLAVKTQKFVAHKCLNTQGFTKEMNIGGLPNEFCFIKQKDFVLEKGSLD